MIDCTWTQTLSSWSEVQQLYAKLANSALAALDTSRTALYELRHLARERQQTENEEVISCETLLISFINQMGSLSPHSPPASVCLDGSRLLVLQDSISRVNAALMKCSELDEAYNQIFVKWASVGSCLPTLVLMMVIMHRATCHADKPFNSS